MQVSVAGFPALSTVIRFFVVGVFLFMEVPVHSGEPISYSIDVQPILAQKCLLCHGPDVGESGLRLHQRDLALAKLDSGNHGIVPGKTKDSEVLVRASSEDPSIRMPPGDDPLTDEELEILTRWIQEGAQWQTHWAYRPLEKRPIPKVEDESWPANELDFFVLARLEEAGIAPSSEANKTTLIRRLYYDLTGLPPDPSEVDAFLADPDPKAYEKLVDRLLASPHFGERWGRHWLDKARYADSDGYEKDNHRPDAWR